MSAYNSERFIESAIKSVLEQSFTDFEFLITDDGSSDRTPDIVNSFRDERIIFYQNKDNNGFKGFVKNLNLMLEQAKGKYIARMDSDDIWHKEKLEKQVSFLKKNPDIYLAGCHKANLINQDGKRLGIFSLIPDNESFYKYLSKRNPIIHPSIVFTKEKIDTKYRWKLFYTEDYDFHLMNVSKGAKYHSSQEILMDYRVLDNSLSHHHSNRTLIAALFKEKAKEFYRQRMLHGTDRYDDFDPDDILNILDMNHKNDLETLLIALRFSFIAGLEEDFDTLIEKIRKFYYKKSIPLLYKIISIHFGFFQKIYRIKSLLN